MGMTSPFWVHRQVVHPRNEATYRRPHLGRGSGTHSVQDFFREKDSCVFVPNMESSPESDWVEKIVHFVRLWFTVVRKLGWKVVWRSVMRELIADPSQFESVVARASLTLVSSLNFDLSRHLPTTCEQFCRVLLHGHCSLLKALWAAVAPTIAGHSFAGCTASLSHLAPSVQCEDGDLLALVEELGVHQLEPRAQADHLFVNGSSGLPRCAER